MQSVHSGRATQSHSPGLAPARRADSFAPAHDAAPSRESASSYVNAPSSAESQRVPAFAFDAAPAMSLGFVQPKLALSQPDDPSEREADAVADGVLKGDDAGPPNISAATAPPEKEEPVRRQTEGSAEEEKEEEKEKEGKAEGTEEGQVQRACEECEKEETKGEVRREVAAEPGGDSDGGDEGGEGNGDGSSSGGGSSSSGGGGSDGGEGGGFVPDSFGQGLGGGQPLPVPARGFFESRFGQNFGDVRVHTDAAAAHSARSVDALAYTKGRDIVFGEGQYAPGSARGDRLLAHELTHVAQQRGKVMRVQRQRVHMESGRFVGDPGGADNNDRDEVLAAMDRLAEMNAYSSSSAYQNERTAVAALPAANPVSPGVMPETIKAIKANETRTLDPASAKFLGLTISYGVGEGQTNTAPDILQLQDMLHVNWHITDADYATERATISSNLNVSVAETVIPKTIEGIAKLRKAYVGGMHTARFRQQLSLSLEATNRLGSTMTWTPSGPGSGNTFETWASAATQPATSPAWNSSTTINCWEMILLAAFERGLTTWQWIHNLYTAGSGPAWDAALPGRMTSGTMIPYRVGDPNSPSPNRGQIVFFNDDAHVALAEGYRNGAGQNVIISFWPPPGHAAAWGTADQVKLTTIEDLVTYMLSRPTLAPGGVVNVTFANSPW
jgi:Domain of unknown function (DUF4157)